MSDGRITALYERLSQEDKLEGESNSIANHDYELEQSNLITAAETKAQAEEKIPAGGEACNGSVCPGSRR